MASAKKHKYEVEAEFGCGGGMGAHAWWGEQGDMVKLTEKQAEPFLAQGLIRRI